MAAFSRVDKRWRVFRYRSLSRDKELQDVDLLIWWILSDTFWRERVNHVSKNVTLTSFDTCTFCVKVFSI